jgi:hypothetical protein
MKQAITSADDHEMTRRTRHADALATIKAAEVSMPPHWCGTPGGPRAPHLRVEARCKEKVEAQRAEGRICSYAVALPPPHIYRVQITGAA